MLAPNEIWHLFWYPFDGYTVPLDQWINALINWIVDHFRPIFQLVQIPVRVVLSGLRSSLVNAPPTLVLGFSALVAWQLAGGRIGLLASLALLSVGFVGVWEQAMTSLALVLTAVTLCILIGIPLGIACARSDRVEQIMRPLLDTMQTIPTFVYLVPVVMLFGIGDVPGAIATIIYAVPPLIRLTNLGIRQVSPDMIEASLAFGATPLQLLTDVQLPLALPTILAGVNQTVLFALGMSVITAMIAVPGLGLMVLQGMGQLDVGMAAVGGLGIVVLAIALDRITQAIGNLDSLQALGDRGPIGMVRRWRSPSQETRLAQDPKNK